MNIDLSTLASVIASLFAAAVLVRFLAASYGADRTAAAAV